MSTLRDKQRTRRTLVMAGLAAALSLLAIAAHLGGGAPVQTSARTGEPVFPDFASQRAEASGIRITLADETYMLVATGEGWRLGSREGYPIRQDRLAELAAGLESLIWDTPRTDDPEKLGRIGLGDPRESGTGALLEVIGPNGETGAALITGRKGEYPAAALQFRSLAGPRLPGYPRRCGLGCPPDRQQRRESVPATRSRLQRPRLPPCPAFPELPADEPAGGHRPGACADAILAHRREAGLGAAQAGGRPPHHADP